MAQTDCVSIQSEQSENTSELWEIVYKRYFMKFETLQMIFSKHQELGEELNRWEEREHGNKKKYKICVIDKLEPSHNIVIILEYRWERRIKPTRLLGNGLLPGR